MKNQRHFLFTPFASFFKLYSLHVYFIRVRLSVKIIRLLLTRRINLLTILRVSTGRSFIFQRAPIFNSSKGTHVNSQTKSRYPADINIDIKFFCKSLKRSSLEIVSLLFLFLYETWQTCAVEFTWTRQTSMPASMHGNWSVERGAKN